MRVLAIDASLRNTGVAIVDANNGKPQSVYFGTIHNKSAMRPSSCLVCIRDRLAELIREHGKYRHYDNDRKPGRIVRRRLHCLPVRVKPLLSNLSIPC